MAQEKLEFSRYRERQVGGRARDLEEAGRCEGGKQKCLPSSTPKCWEGNDDVRGVQGSASMGKELICVPAVAAMFHTADSLDRKMGAQCR